MPDTSGEATPACSRERQLMDGAAQPKAEPRTRRQHASPIALLTLCFCLCGCPQGVDDRADHDGLINDVWLVDFETEDAIAFLERGGTHYDLPEVSSDIDQEVVLPLLKRFRDEFNTDTTAVLETDVNWAWAILVKLPADPIARSQIETAIEQADAEFDGVIQMEWGYQWLSLSFLSAEEAAAAQAKEEYGARE